MLLAHRIESALIIDLSRISRRRQSICQHILKSDVSLELLLFARSHVSRPVRRIQRSSSVLRRVLASPKARRED